MHKLQRPVRSARAAETLAYGEAMKKKVLTRGVGFPPTAFVKLTVALYSEDRFFSLSTQLHMIERSMRADVRVIWYAFEMGGCCRFISISGLKVPADRRLQPSSPFPDDLHLLLTAERIQISFFATLLRLINHSYGMNSDKSMNTPKARVSCDPDTGNSEGSIEGPNLSSFDLEQ